MNVDEPVEYSDSANLPARVGTGVVRRSLFDLEPKQQVQKATEIANALADIIEKQKLYTVIQGKKHVKVDGWALMGTFLGILPREKSVTRLEDGSYEAQVELIKAMDGSILGGASSICSVTEKRWGASEDYARRSMAITRATGKAYRLAFSWIIALAGYSPTPAEEMPADTPQQNERGANTPSEKSKIYTGQTDQQEAVQEVLKNKKVPEERWPEVHNRLMNRPGKDLTKILQEMTNGN